MELVQRLKVAAARLDLHMYLKRIMTRIGENAQFLLVSGLYFEIDSLYSLGRTE